MFGFGFLGGFLFVCFCLLLVFFNLHKPLEGITVVSLSELKFCHSGASSDSLFYAVPKKSG